MKIGGSLILAIIIFTTGCHMREFSGENVSTIDNEVTSHIVQFLKDGKAIASFKVELAMTNEERSRGLMYRKSMSEDSGMLFIFKDNGDHTFWMKNTYIPLDMIFINSDLEVVGVYKNAVPLSEESISVKKASRYVLEINAGLSDKYGIDESTKVLFINIFP